MKTFRSVVLLVVLVLSTLLTSVVFAQSETEIPVVSGVARDDGVDFPSEVPAGLVNFVFENDRAEAAFSPIIARLNDDVTMEDFFATQESGDPMAGVFLVTLYGGTEIAAGEDLSFITDLAPGNYMILEMSGASLPVPFTAVESDMERPEMPEADVTLALVDFAFGVPAQISAGSQVWNIHNFGGQFHETAIMKVDDGTTLREVRNTLMSMSMDPESEEPSPYESAFFWAPMGVDTQAWVTIDLEPGTYAIACYLPDIDGDFAPHLAHGMLQIFTVE